MADNNRDTSSTLPTDRNSGQIQVLAPDDTNVTFATAAGSTTAAAEIAGLTADRPNIVEVASISDIHIIFGGASVGAASVTTSRLFVKGAAVYKLLPSQTHVRVIQAADSSGGAVTITPLL